MESSHMVVLERLSAATAQVEALARDVARLSLSSKEEDMDEKSTMDTVPPALQFVREVNGTLMVRPPVTPSLTVEECLAQEHDVLKVRLGSEAAWRRVCRLEGKLRQLSGTDSSAAGVYSLWRSTATLDRVELTAQELAHAVAAAEGAAEMHGSGEGEGAAGEDEDEDDPFGWVTGGQEKTPHHTAAEGRHSTSGGGGAVVDPAMVPHRAREDEAYAKAAAQDLFSLFQARQRVGSSVEMVEQRLASMVSDLDKLFADSTGQMDVTESETPLARAQKWLLWSPTYTVTSADEQRTVWDRLAMDSNTDSTETTKAWQDLVLLCDMNRSRLEQLVARWQRVQGEYVSLLQTHNMKMAQAMLELDALEARQQGSTSL